MIEAINPMGALPPVAGRQPMSRHLLMATQQLSITLDEELVAFIDQQGSNRSAAIAEAVRRWRDELWQDEVNRAYAEQPATACQR